MLPMLHTGFSLHFKISMCAVRIFLGRAAVLKIEKMSMPGGGGGGGGAGMLIFSIFCGSSQKIAQLTYRKFIVQ